MIDPGPVERKEDNSSQQDLSRTPESKVLPIQPLTNTKKD
jgi:hypothetical protein